MISAIPALSSAPVDDGVADDLLEVWIVDDFQSLLGVEHDVATVIRFDDLRLHIFTRGAEVGVDMGDEGNGRDLAGRGVVGRQVAGHRREDVAPLVHFGVVAAELLELFGEHP